jgi:uncharacterized protein (TIGR02246 family)
MANSPQGDEAAIRALIAEWLEASAAGKNERVLELMAEDVVFLVPGRPPMRGRAAFAAAQRGMGGVRFEGKSEVQEVRVFGDRAYALTQLTVVMTPPGGGKPVKRAGPTLSVLRKEQGKWVLFRDANLLSVVEPGS